MDNISAPPSFVKNNEGQNFAKSLNGVFWRHDYVLYRYSTIKIFGVGSVPVARGMAASVMMPEHMTNVKRLCSVVKAFRSACRA